MVELRANALYELISTTETSSETNSSEDIVLPDIDEIAFEALLLFIYKDTLPTITGHTALNGTTIDTATANVPMRIGLMTG